MISVAVKPALAHLPRSCRVSRSDPTPSHLATRIAARGPQPAVIPQQPVHSRRRQPKQLRNFFGRLDRTCPASMCDRSTPEPQFRVWFRSSRYTLSSRPAQPAPKHPDAVRRSRVRSPSPTSRQHSFRLAAPPSHLAGCGNVAPIHHDGRPANANAGPHCPAFILSSRAASGTAGQGQGRPKAKSLLLPVHAVE